MYPAAREGRKTGFIYLTNDHAFTRYGIANHIAAKLLHSTIYSDLMILFFD